MAFYLLHDSEQNSKKEKAKAKAKAKGKGAKLVKKLPKAGGRACFSQLFCNGAGRKVQAKQRSRRKRDARVAIKAGQVSPADVLEMVAICK